MLYFLVGTGTVVALLVAAMRYGYRNGVLDAVTCPESEPVQAVLRKHL